MQKDEDDAMCSICSSYQVIYWLVRFDCYSI